jgi:carbon-monoxide dehydrogenase large subunit
VGGGFGSKCGAYPEDVPAAYLSRKLGRPIIWLETRTEHIQSTVHGRSHIAYLDLAADPSGRITGLRLKLICDSGAYGAAWSADTTAGMITGCYNIPNVKSEAITVLTNKTPLGAYRGAGRPEAAYHVERGVDALARKMGVDSIEVRLRSFIPPDAFPYSAPDWPDFDSGEYARAMDAALERSGYQALRAEQEQARSEGRLVGVGTASYVEVCGFGWETSTVRVDPDGTVFIYTGISPHGQGQETTFAQMAADVLGVEPEQVTVRYGDTSMGSGFGTMGSRGTAVGGPAVYRASQTLSEKMRQIAAHMMEAAPEDLELGDGRWEVRGVPDRFITVKDVASAAYNPSSLPKEMEPGLTAVNNFDPGAITAPFGTHVCMVEVDRETGRVEILNYLSVDDCGTIVSPQLVTGQVHGGLAQGISQALYEEMVYSDDGQILTGTLVDYALPTANELPLYETSHTNTPTPHNELGIKGIGEAATIGSTPAVVNAVVDALSPLGVENLDMPLTPQRVWQAMQSAKESR